MIDHLINESKYETDPIRSFNLFRQIEINSSMDYPYINLFNRIYFIWLARSWISNIPESGSLLSSSFGFQFQYISKNIPSTSTTTAPTNSQNTPSFGTTAIVLAVLCIFISKKFQTKKMR